MAGPEPKLRALFSKAAECQTAEEQVAFLDQACQGDAELRAQLDDLLRAHREAGSFLQEPTGPGQAPAGARNTDGSGQAEDGPALDFLAPAEEPGLLGRLGHYEVQEVIGRGGMGTVLRAFDQELHRVVAIKVMSQQLATNTTARKRFKREAQAVAAVTHDHIVTIHAVEEASGLPYLVMHYIAGLSLQQRLDRDGPLELHEVLRIGMQAAAGLAAAHAQGLVHRDIKPANILLENGVERVKITDFGLARAAADASLTQSGMVAGTPQYMSPEQAEGKDIDPRTDLFSLGSVLYAMCTGRPPFRASGTMAVLKRVCEETPTPIRDTHPEIPEWLVAIIDKLHAKDPALRYQSAREVAEILGQHLAQLQLPSATPVAPLAEVGTGARLRGRLAVAAAVLLLALGGLSLTEATGVTNLHATVLRIFMPDGTLIVETDDPAVKVTVEGDGGLVITGAGLQEIRLRPGSYRVLADRDGKPVPLDRHLVTVSRGGRAIVKVKLEGPPGAASATAEKGAFVLLVAGKERRLDTLAEAVLTSSDGDIIEVRGNGPFVTQPVAIKNRALTIRAGEGFRPVIKADPDEQGDKLLSTNAPLVLEGLDFQWVDGKVFSSPGRNPRLVVATGSASWLQVANCRFLMNRKEGRHDGMECIGALDTPLCRLRNCQLLMAGHGRVWGSNLGVRCIPNGELVIDNCLIVGNGTLLNLSHTEPMKVVQNHNTYLGSPSSHVSLRPTKKIDPPPGKENPRPLQIETSANIFSGPLWFSQFASFLSTDNALEAEQFLTRLIGWRENRNLYLLPEDRALLHLNVEMPPGQYNSLPLTAPLKKLTDWQRFWGMTELDSLREQARFQGGDLLTRAGLTPDLLTPEDFRLRPDSPGYRAGKDGKDLGADVDLVGPGPAYERWKKTPEYRQWVKDSGQLRAEASKPEATAFVVMGGPGVAERKFDTLAEAVRNASDDDTIEIRGNGPFVSEPIEIPVGRALIIRAAEGFRPVIRANPEEKGLHLLNTKSPLVLEGLDFQWVDAKPYDRTDGAPQLLVVSAGPKSRLDVANCRLLMNRRDGFHETMQCIGAWNTLFCRLRNCQLGIGGNGAVRGTCLVFQGNPQSELIVDNCLFNTPGVTLSLLDAEPRTAVLKRNTLLGAPAALQMTLTKKIDPPLAKKGSRPVQAEVSANIFHCSMLFTQGSGFLAKEKALSASEAEQLLKKLVDWRENRNLYFTPDDVDLFSLLMLPRPGKAVFLSPTAPIKTLADWKRFWDLQETDSQLGQARFQGGDLLAKAGLTPHLLTPEDFRLRPDSPGYRAGKDGKDLGADVDLVGPGPAYERWKKTPEYQQWLRETGQLRANAPKPETNAFVVLTGKGDEVRKYDTLAEAVQGASDGDNIEIRGNGPFVSESVDIQRIALTIRAGAGCRPVIQLSPEGIQSKACLLNANAALVLEGLELHHRAASDYGNMVVHADGPLRAANCRFRDGVFANSPGCVFRNCEFRYVGGVYRPGSRWTFDNCLARTKGTAMIPNYDDASLHDVLIQIKRSTFMSGFASLNPSQSTPPIPANPPRVAKPIRLDVSECIFEAPNVLGFDQSQKSLDKVAVLQPAETEATLLRLLEWRGARNLFAVGSMSVAWTAHWNHQPPHGPKNLEEWNRFWGGAETDSQEGTPRFQGGNLRSRAEISIDQLTPEDFRLRPDSPGYRAGKDGKDLGADVDLVGPGPAYERWKQTSEYQQWLKETAQVKK